LFAELDSYTAFAVAQIFITPRRKLSLAPPISQLPRTKHKVQKLAQRVQSKAASKVGEKYMLSVHTQNVGPMAVIQCEGRIVRSEAAFELRKAVSLQSDARIIVLDLSEVTAIEGGGLGMLVFLQRWAHDHDIRFKLFNPRQSVRDRLEQASSMRELDIATLDEMMALLACADGHFAHAA
jgi:anti-anti-sigma regulatory factor